MNKFVNAVSYEADFNGVKTKTENGADARFSTGSKVLNMYGTIGALRNRSEYEIVEKFKASWNEDALLTLKMAFYARNIRGGLGERDTARICLRWVAQNYPETMVKNFENVVKFGRADDLYTFIDTPIEKDMWAFIKATLYKDIERMNEKKSISLMAKWLKSVNTSSKESRKLGAMTAYNLGLSEKEYRKLLAEMRRYIGVLEVAMSSGDWKQVEYSAVPSRAMAKYRKAFKRHDSERFEKFLSRVEKGEVKINADTLYPYDLVKKYLTSCWNSCSREDRVVEAQWKALPNYIDGENNVLVMADVSGSMYCADARPIASSIGLALYFAEHNQGDFHGLYMTFSRQPNFIKVQDGNTLCQNVKSVLNTGVGYDTNLEAAFDKILDTCIKNNISKEDMPKALVVVSDMQINCYNSGYGLDFVTEMALRFHQKGYTMPKLILWNVEARRDTFLASKTNPYVQFASGSSTSTFKSILESIGMDAYEAMMKTLSNPLYDCVIL